jgi:SAM-dependent methyltransferase
VADSDGHWRRWGETDPYFGVLTDSRFRAGAIGANRDAFFETGRVVVDERLSAAQRHFGPVARGRALEFGCGVGRLTVPLAGAFDAVTALDIAPAMLAEARRNADAAGIDNIHLALSDDELSRAEGQFDFILSIIVFQHIPVRRGLRIIDALLGKVAPGGVVALQLCIDRHDGLASRMRFWAQENLPGVHELVNLKRGRTWREPFTQMNAYPLADVLALGDAADIGEYVLDTFADRRFRSAQLLMKRR